MQSTFDMKTLRSVFIWIGLSSAKSQIRLGSPINNTLILLPFLIQLCFVVVEVYLFVEFVTKYSGKFSSTLQFTDIIYFCALIIAGIAQILEILKFSSDQQIEKFIDEIDANISARHLCRVQSRCLFCRKRNIKRQLVTRALFFVLGFSILDIIMLSTITVKVWYEAILNRIITITMLRIGIVQVTFYFCWVSKRSNVRFSIILFCQLQFLCS